MTLTSLKPREQKGSRARCVLLSDSPQVHRGLTALVAPHATLTPTDLLAPRGFADAAEPQLGRDSRFLDEHRRHALRTWRLSVKPHQSRLPVWDLVSTATVLGAPGLVLVEAKAHIAELENERAGKRVGNADNHRQIGRCIDQASVALSQAHRGAWHLSRDSHYQISNRFTWAWKLADLGIPVVLVYLGFLRADEMRSPLADDASWRACVHRHTSDRIPPTAWDTPIFVGNTPLIPLIRSLDVPLR